MITIPDPGFLIPLMVLAVALLVTGAILILGDPARIARRDAANPARLEAMRRHPSNRFRPAPDPLTSNLDRSLPR